MSDTGLRAPGSIVDNASIGVVAWSNPNNAGASDDSRASVVLSADPNDISHYLWATQYGLSALIPADATIDGVDLTLERSASELVILDYSVRLIVDGSVQGTDKADGGTDWPVTDGNAFYGGAADTWGLPDLSADQVRATNFGVAVSAKLRGHGGSKTAFVDAMYLRVWYTAAAAIGRTRQILVARDPAPHLRFL